MLRRCVVVVVVALAALALGAPVVAQDAGDPGAAPTVRIAARLVASGDVEFALELDGAQEWSPRQRLFPYEAATVGRWMFSSPYTLRGGTVVEVQARLVASGKVEFGLRINGAQEWLPPPAPVPLWGRHRGALDVLVAIHGPRPAAASAGAARRRAPRRPRL